MINERQSNKYKLTYYAHKIIMLVKSGYFLLFPCITKQTEYLML